MRKSALLSLPTLVLFSVFALHSHGQSPTPRATTARPSTSTIACPDNTTLPRDKRTPEACAKAAFAEDGHPVMFPARLDISFGVSQSPSKASGVYIWMDNQTEVAQSHYVCCEATFIDFIELYGADGHRVPMKDPDLEKERVNGVETVWACRCSGWVSVPPHTLKAIDGGDLLNIYNLPSGRYSIGEYLSRNYWARMPLLVPTPPDPDGPRLAFSIP
jgi:hypothetical protein